MSQRFPIAVMAAAFVAACGSEEPDRSPEIELTLSAPPARTGLLRVTRETGHYVDDEIVGPRFDLFLLNDRSEVIVPINRISEDSWNVAEPILISGGSRVLFSIHNGPERGIYIYDLVSGQRSRYTEPFTTDTHFNVKVRDNRVIAWVTHKLDLNGMPSYSLNAGRIDHSMPVTSFDVGSDPPRHDDFDVSPDGEWLVWITRGLTAPARLQFAPTSDLSDVTVLRDSENVLAFNRPEFVDSNRLVYRYRPSGVGSNRHALVLTSIDQPDSHTRIDSDPAPEQVRGEFLLHRIEGDRTLFSFRAVLSEQENAIFAGIVDVPSDVRRVDSTEYEFNANEWKISPDGRWLAWTAYGRNILSDLAADPPTPFVVAENIDSAYNQFAFSADNTSLVYTTRGSVFRTFFQEPGLSTRIAVLPENDPVVDLSHLVDGTGFLVHVSTETGRRFWVVDPDSPGGARMLVDEVFDGRWSEHSFIPLP